MSSTAHRTYTTSATGQTSIVVKRKSPASPVPGRTLSVVSPAVGALSLLAAPAVFGLAGVLLGTVAIARGDKLGGMAAVGASAALAVTGFYLAMNF